MLHLESRGKQDVNGPITGDAVVIFYGLDSQYLEPQSSLGSHPDKPAPSGHCEDSGEEESNY